MEQVKLPIPLARRVMKAAPASLLNKAVSTLMRNMQNRHPRLFKSLAGMGATVVHIDPTDLPHRFVLSYGQKQVALRLADKDEQEPDAVIQGTLATLISLLEGRMDSDTSFFTRDLRITGDTSVIVGLRNTLDREEIDLLEDIVSLSGSFARPLGLAVTILDRIVQTIKQRTFHFHETLHQSDSTRRNLENEYDQLRADMQLLRTQLAKFEARTKRANQAAA